MIEKFISFVRDNYRTNDFIPLHAPSFTGNEKAYVIDTIESTFVSSVGKYVDLFESKIESFTGVAKAVATVNGTCALHTALYMAGVKSNDLVITQPLTFVATVNAIAQLGAQPVFVDVAKESLGLCPQALSHYLDTNAELNQDGACVHKKTGQAIRAVVPMNTFGHPVDIGEILSVCESWNIELVEDAAESLGSYYKGEHTGKQARFAVLSFNGNKVITTGGGGMVLCRDICDGDRAKHITTTAKKPHAYEFYHDELGFNYRLPNINAALGCAQMEVLEDVLARKRELAAQYRSFFMGSELEFIVEPGNAKSNYWLNAVVCPDKHYRTEFLKVTNEYGVMTRPVWTLMQRLPMYEQSLCGDLDNAIFLEERIVNIPSSPIFG